MRGVTLYSRFGLGSGYIAGRARPHTAHSAPAPRGSTGFPPSWPLQPMTRPLNSTFNRRFVKNVRHVPEGLVVFEKTLSHPGWHFT